MKGYQLTLVEAPTALPVTVEQVKYDLRIEQDDTEQDAALKEYIADAVDFASGPDGVTGRALMPQKWALTLPAVGGRIALPVLPVIEIDSITFKDEEGSTQSADLADYILTKGDDWAHLEPLPGKAWPAAACRPDAITISFMAGYADADAVPVSLKRAIRLIAAHWYLNRGVVVVGTIVAQIPMGAQVLLDRHRLGWVG